jgi:hypothetical protein
MVFGTGMGEITAMTPGSVKGLHLVVADIPTARSALVNRGIEVGEITDSLCKPTSGRFFRQWAVRRGHLTLQ